MSSIKSKFKDSKLKKQLPRVLDHPAKVNYYHEGQFLHDVPIDEIKPNPDQPRQHFDKQSLDELSRSIKEKGLLQPIIIRIDEKQRINLVAGERRLRASKKAGLKQIPAIVTKGNPAEIALIENLQREDLNPIEEAEALARMIDEHKYTQEQLAQVIGKSRPQVTQVLGLNRLPKEIKNECSRANTYPEKNLVSNRQTKESRQNEISF